MPQDLHHRCAEPGVCLSFTVTPAHGNSWIPMGISSDRTGGDHIETPLTQRDSCSFKEALTFIRALDSLPHTLWADVLGFGIRENVVLTPALPLPVSVWHSTESAVIATLYCCWERTEALMQGKGLGRTRVWSVVSRPSGSLSCTHRVRHGALV